MPTYHARDIDVRLLVSNLADSTTNFPEQTNRHLALAQADSYFAVLSNGTPLKEEFVTSPEDGLKLHLIGDEVNKVPVYVVRTQTPALQTSEVITKRQRTRRLSTSARNTPTSSSNNENQTDSRMKLLATTPLALTVDLRFGKKALKTAKTLNKHGLDDPDVNLDLGSAIGFRYDVLVNSNLVDSNFVDPTKLLLPTTSSTSDGAIRVLISGQRVDKNLERPIVLCPPGINAFGEIPEVTHGNCRTSAVKRWNSINKGLAKLAKDMEHWGSSSSLPQFLCTWAKMPLPDGMDVQREYVRGVTTSLAYGVVDVIISLGRGQRASWWKRVFWTHHPLDYTTFKFAKDKLEREGNQTWYENHLKAHVETMQRIRQIAMNTGKDEDGEDISDDEVTKQYAGLVNNFTTNGIAVAITESASTYCLKSAEKEHAAIDPPPILVRRRRGRPLGSKTRKRKTENGQAAILNPAKTPNVTLAGSSADKTLIRTQQTYSVTQESLVMSQSASKKSRLTIPSTTARGKTGIQSSERDVLLHEYLSTLKKEWKKPKQCSESVLTFAEDGVWRQAAGGEARGGYLRHVRGRRAAKFDDEEVVFAVRFVVG